MDHGISSRRTEVMLRRRMQYLTDEAKHEAAALAAGGADGVKSIFVEGASTEDRPVHFTLRGG